MNRKGQSSAVEKLPSAGLAILVLVIVISGLILFFIGSYLGGGNQGIIETFKNILPNFYRPTSIEYNSFKILLINDL